MIHMVYFNVFVLLIAAAAAGIYFWMRFKNSVKLSDSLVNAMSSFIIKGTYLDTQISAFVNRKTLWLLRRSGNSGRDEDLQRLPDYMIKENLVKANLNKFVLVHKSGDVYFSDGFVAYVKENCQNTIVEAFDSVLNEYYTKMVQEDGADNMKKSIDKKNSVFSEEFDKKFADAKFKQENPYVIDENIVVSKVAIDSIKRYANNETNLIFNKRRLPVNDLYGKRTSAFRLEYSKQYAKLLPIFVKDDKFTRDFVLFVKKNHPKSTQLGMIELMDAYLKSIHYTSRD